jgi:RNA polymerase sigma factor (sigma-70 family)
MSQSGTVVQITGGNPASDRDFLDKLFRKYEVVLRRFLRLRLRSENDVDDVVQEVFIRLSSQNRAETISSATDGAARGYIFTIANNLVIDQGRHAQMCKRHGLTEVSEMPEAPTEFTPERAVLVEEELQRAKVILLRQNPKVQRAFVLSRFKQMNYREIAEEMGVKQKRVEKYISTALAALRRDRENRNV